MMMIEEEDETEEPINHVDECRKMNFLAGINSESEDDDWTPSPTGLESTATDFSSMSLISDDVNAVEQPAGSISIGKATILPNPVITPSKGGHTIKLMPTFDKTSTIRKFCKTCVERGVTESDAAVPCQHHHQTIAEQQSGKLVNSPIRARKMNNLTPEILASLIIEPTGSADMSISSSDAANSIEIVSPLNKVFILALNKLDNYVKSLKERRKSGRRRQ